MLSLVDLQHVRSLTPKARLQHLYGLYCPEYPMVPWCSLVWNKISTPRISFCVWLTCLNRLPVKDRLHAWGIVNDNLYPFCHLVPETRDHIFSQCSVISPVFDKMLHLIGLHYSPATNFSFLLGPVLLCY